MAAIRISAAELIDRAYDDPQFVIERAREMLDADATPPLDRCRARWALGLAHREEGDVSIAIEHFTIAREVASDLHEQGLAARISTTLALSLAQTGRSAQALELLADAQPFATGVDRGHLQLQRGLVRFLRDDLTEAALQIQDALATFERVGGVLDQARAHLNLGVVVGADNQHEAALHHSELASAGAEASGNRLLAAQAQHNIGYAAYRLGDVARALAEMSNAEERLRGLDDTTAFRATVLGDRAQVLLDANLVQEACDESDRALEVAQRGTNALMTAEATLLSARCHLRNEDFSFAADQAAHARRLLTECGRDSWRALADLIEVHAEAGEDHLRIDVERAESVALELADSRWRNETAAAAVLATEALINVGDADRAIAVLDRCRRQPLGPTAVERSGAALVRAAYHLLRGDKGSARRAITKGLRLLTENHAAVGALELRAHGIAHGQTLTEIGVALAYNDGHSRELLSRAEHGRGATALLPRARPLDDKRSRELITKLRSLTLESHQQNESSAAARRIREHDLVAVETELRRRSRRSSAGSEVALLDVGHALRVLGTRHLLEFVDVEDQLVVVHATSNRTSHAQVLAGDLRRNLDDIELVLGRLQRSRTSPASFAAAQLTLEQIGQSLSEQFVPKRVRESDDAVVIVPCGGLYAVPWSIVPEFRGRPVAVTPSLLAWLSVGSKPRVGRSTAFFAGPDLPFSLSEVDQLGAVVDGSSTLAGKAATVSRCLDLLCGVDVAHFACHGRFRADSPLFSSLRLADGDLTFYDLEQCERLPHTIVMSACNAGQNAVLQGGALLGMASALIQLGVSSVIAPLTPVNDERSVDLMVRLHTHLATGSEPAEALAKASIGPDGELDATAAPFICFGS